MFYSFGRDCFNLLMSHFLVSPQILLLVSAPAAPSPVSLCPWFHKEYVLCTKPLLDPVSGVLKQTRNRAAVRVLNLHTGKLVELHRRHLMRRRQFCTIEDDFLGKISDDMCCNIGDDIKGEEDILYFRRRHFLYCIIEEQNCSDYRRRNVWFYRNLRRLQFWKYTRRPF